MFGQKSASTTVTVYIHFDITCNHTQTHCQRAISTHCQTHFMDNLRYTNFLDDAFTTCLRSVWDLLHSNITVHDKRSITDLHRYLYSTAMLLGSPKKKKKSFIMCCVHLVTYPKHVLFKGAYACVRVFVHSCAVTHVCVTQTNPIRALSLSLYIYLNPLPEINPGTFCKCLCSSLSTFLQHSLEFTGTRLKTIQSLS